MKLPGTKLQGPKKYQTSKIKHQLRLALGGGVTARLGLRLRGSGGFTLIEIVISSALMALILVSAYACLSAGFASQKQLEPRIEVLQNARVAMALMTADLRAACPLSKDTEFVGMPRQLGDIEADNLDFGTHNYTPRRAREGDFCQTSFYVDKDPETGRYSLFRRRNPMIAPDPFSGGSREEIAKGIVGLKFEYFDGLDWYSSWGATKSPDKQQASAKQQSNEEGLPKAVRITAWFEEPTPRRASQSGEEEKRERPLVFQTVVRLELADVPEPGGSSGGSQDTSGQSGAMGQERGGSQ